MTTKDELEAEFKALDDEHVKARGRDKALRDQLWIVAVELDRRFPGKADPEVVHQWRIRLGLPPLASTPQPPPERPPERPGRKEPSLRAIARYHGIIDKPSHCWKCRKMVGHPTWTGASNLERAHVIDRSAGGLDHEANLRPLCAECHKYQPIFENGEEELALAWFALREPASKTWVNEFLEAMWEMHHIERGMLVCANTVANGFYKIPPDWIARLGRMPLEEFLRMGDIGD